MIPREERGPVLNGLPTTLPDVDPEETQEWIESLDKMVETDGPNRARIVLLKMLERARSHSRLGLSALTSTDYINTIAAGVLSRASRPTSSPKTATTSQAATDGVEVM